MNDLFKGMTKHHLVQTILLTVWLTLAAIGFHELHIANWPAFLAVVFFFTFHFDKNSIKVIFGGGVVGLLYGMLIPGTLAFLTPMVGASIALYIYLAVALFTIILLGAISHTLFNSVTFGYVLLNLINGSIIAESTVPWFLTLIIGGGICVGGLYAIVTFLNKDSKKVVEPLEAN